MSLSVEPLARIDIPSWGIAPPHDRLEINLREMWDFRELLCFLVWRDLKVRYKQTAIGMAWVVLQPFLAMMPSEGLQYPNRYNVRAVRGALWA